MWREPCICKYFSMNASTIIPISTVVFPTVTVFFLFFLSAARMHCPIYLNSCQWWCALCAQMGRILISFLLSKCIPCFGGCANSGTSGSHQICDICVLLDVCPRFLKQSGIYIHLKSALFYSAGVSP